MLLLMSLRVKLHSKNLHPDAGYMMHPILCRASHIALPVVTGRSNYFTAIKKCACNGGSVWAHRSFINQEGLKYPAITTLNKIHILLII